jgi:molybdopterin/thiamine biosynthesis adenylyltransferase
VSQAERYSRQTVLKEIGAAGQKRLLDSRVLVVGCGALGCTQAQLLARAGVGTLRLVDRDFVELSNLQRQLLFDEDDVASRLPKAEAAARKLRRVNSAIQIEGLVTDLTPRNALELVASSDIVLDATDNLETRYLLNDASVKLGKPWIYGGAVGSSGVLLPVVPGEGPCLRCLFGEPPPPGTLPTCDLLGVLNTAPALVATLQVTEALRLLLGEPARPRVVTADLWDLSVRRVEVARDPACRCCGERRFDFLDAVETSTATSLCGRNAVQLSPARACKLDLEALATRLAEAGSVAGNGFLLQFETGEHEIVVFADGRAIVRGTSDPAVARSLYARWIGS